MLTIIFILLLVSSIADHTNSLEQKYIIGGQVASNEQFPYQASLRLTNNGTHFCGGSIISRDWILTAAHCVVGKLPNQVLVVVGTNFLNRGGSTHGVFSIIIHGNFNPTNKINDIAALHLKTQISSAPGVASIALTPTATPNDKLVVLAGWGYIKYPSQTISNELRYIYLKTISVSQCQKSLPSHAVFNSHVCTYVNLGLGSCEGDFGSPLVLNGMQHGIASWGISCAVGKPDIFTSVSFYRNWIKSVTNV